MRKRFLGTSMVGVLVLLILSSTALAQRTRSQTAAPPAANDLKIKYRVSMAGGQAMETTTMLKGARERSEMKMGYGMDIINITQCDLKRTIQVSDNAKKYVVTPMETGVTGNGIDTTTAAAATSEPSRRGGVVTYHSSAVDTGERKEMFGFKARHVKTTMTIESSPDACSPMKQRMEIDGWYIDLAFGLNCETGGAPSMGGPGGGGGCRDRVRFTRQGAARTGYALSETTTMYGPNGQVSFSSTKEVIELSREPLNSALFDVPAGYVETKDSQELYGMPSMAAMTSQASSDSQSMAENLGNSSSLRNHGNAKAPGAVRVGVVRLINRTDRSVSLESLQQRLISEIQGNDIEAVALNASSPAEAESEAKAKQCDFVLYTDIATLKTSAAKKLGGMFGRAAGVSGIDKTEAKVEYRLFAVGESTARLQSAAAAKEEGDEASAGTAIDQEARMVSQEARKKNRN